MIVLGIDTSAYANAVGLVDGKKVLANSQCEARTNSLEKIVSHINLVLKGAGLTLGEVQGFGVGLGPGSWTGVRVGVTVGKVLAFSTEKPVAGVPTLAALAYHAREESSLICPVISTGAGDTVYAAFYRSQAGAVTRTGEYYVGDIQKLIGMIREPTVLVGDESQLCNLWPHQAQDNIKIVPAVPDGSVVARLAAIRLEAGDSDDALSLAPLYLKESTARAFLGRYASKN
ncbi:MAG: tRNA (adenosine(37)-N6)-threonylcarbamoyltransferase complex dimerization subunit type 1 TsaB [Chloroflexi bacterium RBG_16_50_9]|nr:MAG: tRNA (adenosine(37)-N6)-threonylcarbamoyltransferase complex dimerization subunit type 1 TsaB [Chloroflexi bacterium RBG_16_50_9]